MTLASKKCPRCGETKPQDSFKKDASTVSGLTCWCRSCCSFSAKRHRNNNKNKHMFWAIKGRARRNGIPFNLEVSDILIPEYCPLLNIKINQPLSGKLSGNSPSVDRINPKLGYVKGNVRIISNRANTLKNNATIKELELLIKNLRSYSDSI